MFKMLVVPSLTWPILFGQPHLHQTDALVDHGKKQVHCRHPSMNLIAHCRNDNHANSFPLPSNDSTNSVSVQLTSQESGANIICLFTGMPGMDTVKPYQASVFCYHIGMVPPSVSSLFVVQLPPNLA